MTIGSLLAVLVAGYVVLTTVMREPVIVRSWRLRLPAPGLAMLQVLISLLDWSLAALALYLLLPPDPSIGFFHFLGIFALGNLGGLISNVPGGVGVFEAVVLLALPDGGSSAAVAAALLAYRLIYYVLPLLLAALLLGAHQLLTTVPLARRFGDWALMLSPNLFALMVFTSGIILLASSAGRTLAHRTAALAEVVPLGLIEISHFLASIAGLLLLLVAWGYAGGWMAPGWRRS
jgi:phosphatidylglycerol lysyltransferase